ncbi:MAG: hypothetical protein K1Y36_30425 [Blastocatellia bacterium]|nr:hypothetical protein [Blastocatellia bacterium]
MQIAHFGKCLLGETLFTAQAGNENSKFTGEFVVFHRRECKNIPAKRLLSTGSLSKDSSACKSSWMSQKKQISIKGFGVKSSAQKRIKKPCFLGESWYRIARIARPFPRGRKTAWPKMPNAALGCKSWGGTP